MVKSAQDVASDDAAAALNRSAMWSIFLQAEMGPCRVVMRSVFLQDAPKMGLAPHDHVVKTLTSGSSRLRARHIRSAMAIEAR